MISPAIHILDYQTEKILGTLENKEHTALFWNDLHKDSLKNNKETFDFTMQATVKEAEFVSKRNLVIIPDEDGYFREFIILETYQHERKKEVRCNASFSEIAKQKILDPVVLEGQTINTAADYVLTGTEWQLGITEMAGTRKVEFEEYTDALTGLNTLASIFELELRFRVEIKANRIIGRYVDFIQRTGQDNKKEIVLGKDLIGVKRRENSDIVTALIGIGPEKEDGTRIIVRVYDNDALQRWGKKGRHLWGIYTPETSDLNMTTERLTTLTREELDKRINTSVQYEADAASIEHIFGFEHEKARKGDRVRIKDTSYVPPLYLEARVIDVERAVSNRSRKKFILGDFIEYSEEDIMAAFKNMKALIALKEQLTKSPTSPADPYPNQLWIDTSDPTQDVWKRWDDLNQVWKEGPGGPQGPNIVDSTTQIEADVIKSNHIGVAILSAISADLGSITAGNMEGVSITLGGLNNENGVAIVQNANGEAVFNLDASDIGSSYMYIGKIDSPSVLSVQQESATIYVNGATGDDLNDGLTSSTPFKTIQAALDSIPKYLNSSVTVDVATATYNEDVWVIGFTGVGNLNINLNKCGINGRLTVQNCSNIVTVSGQDFNNHSKIGTVNTNHPISVVTSQYVILNNLWGKANNRADYAIYVAASNVYTYHCVHERANVAGMYTTVGGNLYAYAGRGSGNVYAAKAEAGSRIHMEYRRPGYTTASTTTASGGTVTESAGITTVLSPGDTGGGSPEPVTVVQGKLLETSASCLSYGDMYGWRSGNTLYQGSYGYGNHKGLMFFNASSMQTTLTGKTIKSVRLYMTRSGGGGSSSSSKLYFYLHNYLSQPAGNPALGTYLGALGSYAWREAKWITLPVSVGEAIRDGTAKGLAIYSSSGKPYVIMNPAVQLEISYEG